MPPRLSTVRTQVAIVGAGPAGLMLGHLLRQAGIDAMIVERQTRAHVEGRIRAGVLEDTTTNILERLGIDGRMRKEGLPHSGVNLADGQRLIRIDIKRLTGRPVMVYGQTEVTRDLIDAAPARGLEIAWEADEVRLHRAPSHEGQRIDCLTDRGRRRMLFRRRPQQARCLGRVADEIAAQRPQHRVYALHQHGADGA